MSRGHGMQNLLKPAVERAKSSGVRRGKKAKNHCKLEPQPHGGALLSGGLPGNKGGTGRPTNAFKDAVIAIASDPAFLQSIHAICLDPKHPQCVSAARFVAEYAEGKPSQPVQHSGEIVHRVEYTDEDTGE